MLVAVSCTKVHNVTRNKYKFVEMVQETAAYDRVLTVAIDTISTCYSRWCSKYTGTEVTYRNA